MAAVEAKRLVAPPGLGGQDVDNPVAKTHLGLEHAAGGGAGNPRLGGDGALAAWLELGRGDKHGVKKS